MLARYVIPAAVICGELVLAVEPSDTDGQNHSCVCVVPFFGEAKPLPVTPTVVPPVIGSAVVVVVVALQDVEVIVGLVLLDTVVLGGVPVVLGGVTVVLDGVMVQTPCTMAGGA